MHILQAVVCLAALARPGGTQLVRYSFNFLGGPTSRLETLDSTGMVRGTFNYLDSYGNVKVQHYDYAAQVGAPTVNFIEHAQAPLTYVPIESARPTPEPVDEVHEPTHYDADHIYDAPEPAHVPEPSHVSEPAHVPGPAYVPEPAHVPEPAQGVLEHAHVPEPVQDVPEPAQGVPEPVKDVRKPAQDVTEPTQDPHELARGTPQPTLPTPAPPTDAAEPNIETTEPQQDATEVHQDIFRSFGQRLRGLVRPTYAYNRRAARRFSRNRREVVASNAVFPYVSPLRFFYGYATPLTYSHPLAYSSAFPVTAYTGIPAATTYVAAPASARDVTLLKVVHNPAHTVSYRAD